MFENENDPDFPYSLGGSCFLARFRNQLVLITAAHCLTGYSPDQLRVEGIENAEISLPLQRLYRMSAPNIEDSAFTDLVILEVAQEQLSRDQQPLITAADLTGLRTQRRPMVQGKTPLAIRGFPFAIRTIDYENRRIRKQGFQTDGVYDGTTDDQHTGFFRYFETELIQDRNGMSGSPVFAFHQTPIGLHSWLAGMHVRGNRVHGRFIEAEVILQALERIYDQQPVGM